MKKILILCFYVNIYIPLCIPTAVPKTLEEFGDVNKLLGTRVPAEIQNKAYYSPYNSFDPFELVVVVQDLPAATYGIIEYPKGGKYLIKLNKATLQKKLPPEEIGKLKEIPTY